MNSVEAYLEELRGAKSGSVEAYLASAPTKVAEVPSSRVDKMRREPARWVAAVGALVALGMAFGLDLTEEQFGTIISVIFVLVGETTRGKVQPADD